jgi:hypothetical protein
VSDIVARLRASVRMGAHNGDAMERGVCGKQMIEAAAEIARLRDLVAGQDDGGHWYSQASMDVVVRERDRLREALEQQRGWWAEGHREGMNDSDAVYILQIKQRDEEIARLREAIHEHRDNVWGERRGIYHDEDMELYAALADTESQNGGTSPQVPTVRDREGT